MGEARFDAVGIVISNLQRAVDFYTLLGLRFPDGAAQSEHGHAEAQTPGGVRLMLDTVEAVRAFDPDWKAPSGSPGVVIGIRCRDAAAVDDLYQRALQAGGKSRKEPWDAFWGQHYALIADPDGNGVDLFADAAR